jgi:hypothetical protein
MKNRNTLCVYSSRLSSSALAAAIVKKFWIEENKKMPNDAGEMIMAVGNKIASFYGLIHFHNWNEGDKLPDFRAYDKVILLGITFDEDVMAGLYDGFRRDFIWIENRKSELFKVHQMSYGKESLLNLIMGLRGDMYNIAELTWIMYSQNGYKMNTLDIKTLCEECGGVVGGSTFDCETGEKPCRCEGHYSELTLYGNIDHIKRMYVKAKKED